MVFYLKYRPSKISELDSQDLVERLTNTLKGKLPDEIPHAFLFTGPKGLGKTSTARILAKAINCTNRKDGEIEPCNKCDSCKAISGGSSLDVLEIDGASNRGIDEIRDLREKIRLAPVASRKKIYIIDEVHMLTTEAFNALLKTLEEPPKHAVFILCTTEVQKVPETIKSRCFNIKFSKATIEDFENSFSRIAKGENLKIEKDALVELVKLSDGSFRDGAKILEELSIHSNQITSDLIEEKFKTQSIEKSVNDLIESFKNKDSKKGIGIVGNLSAENADFKLLVENLIDNLHKELINEISSGNLEKVEEIKRLIEMLVKSHSSIKYAILPQLPLELTIIEWCASDQKSDEKESDTKVEIKTEVKKPIARNDESANILESLIEEIKKENFSIAGVLRGCKIEKFDGKDLVLSTNFKFHKERLGDKKVIELIEKKLEQISGKINFSIELK